MEELKINGNQIFMNKEIPIIYGGFGENQKCISDKTVVELHNFEMREVRKSVLRNIDHFKENIDFIDLKKGGNEITTLELLLSLDYAKQSITQAEHIFIFSRRGYAKLIKIFDTDLAWDIYDKLLDEYFVMREQIQIQPKLPMTYKDALKQLLEQVEKNEKLTDTIIVQNQQIEEMKPKASYYDVILNCKDLVPISIIVKDYGKSAIWLNKYLNKKNVQFKRNRTWILYQKYAEKGYTGTKTYFYSDIQDVNHSTINTYWTQKGRKFIYNLLKEDNILPLIERSK